MRTKHYIIFFSAIIASSLITFYAANYSSSSNDIAYVELQELYDGFELTKELNIELEKFENRKKTILDSLQLDLNMMRKQLESKSVDNKQEIERYNNLVSRYSYFEEKFNNEKEAVVQNFNTQIWNHLNQYLKDYGSKNNIKIIIGANGSGNLMYGSEGVNITNKVIEYVNSKYQAKK